MKTTKHYTHIIMFCSEEGNRTKRGGSLNHIKFWPNGVVKYMIAPDNFRELSTF